MGRTIVFDVHETLLDPSALDPCFERAFGDSGVREQWLAQVIHSALVSTILGQYTSFGSVAGMALDMIALRRGIELSDEDREAIASGMTALPAHAEVRDALQRLRDAGLRLAALTNSAQKTAETQLASAGLDGYFDAILSVEAVRCFKPAIEVYDMAAGRLGEPADRLRLVTAHDWDVAGALNAGWRAAFVARPGKIIAPQARSPDILGADMSEVASQILQVDP